MLRSNASANALLRLLVVGILLGLSTITGCGDPSYEPTTPPGIAYQPEPPENKSQALGEAALEIAKRDAQSILSRPREILPIEETNVEVVTLIEGSGPGAQRGQTLSLRYTGRLVDQTVFDTNEEPGDDPFSVQLGISNVIQGWQIGLQGLKVGERRRMTIPSELAYGATGSGNRIPPNAKLIFEVELLSLEGDPYVEDDGSEGDQAEDESA